MGRALVAAVPLLLFLVLAAAGTAQPYAAGGGFDRPEQVGQAGGPTQLAVAAGAQGVSLFWLDDRGVLRKDLAREDGERIVEARGVRSVAARLVQGDIAVAWVNRDLRTGKAAHWVSWRGEERLLLEALQPYEIELTFTPAGPALLLARREAGKTGLRLLSWEGSETLLLESDLSLVRYRAILDSDGSGYLLWLEGYSDRSAIGFASDEWNAFLAPLDATGRVGQPIALGPASYSKTASRTILRLQDGEVRAMWRGPAGEVLIAGTSGEAVTIGVGVPVGMAGDDAYWAEGASMRRRDVTAASPPVNVAWSPVTIQGGELVERNGVLHLRWYGPGHGGDYLLFAADNASPLEPGLKDRIAASMGWSPWAFWEALTGQLLGALFLGVMVAMALSPLLWLAALLLTRYRLAREPTVDGVAIAGVLLASLLALARAYSSLDRSTHSALFGSPPQILAILLLAGLLTWLLRRRSDSEQLIGILSSGWLYLFVSVAALAFLTLQAWLDYWSLSA